MGSNPTAVTVFDDKTVCTLEKKIAILITYNCMHAAQVYCNPLQLFALGYYSVTCSRSEKKRVGSTKLKRKKESAPRESVKLEHERVDYFAAP